MLSEVPLAKFKIKLNNAKFLIPKVSSMLKVIFDIGQPCTKIFIFIGYLLLICFFRPVAEKDCAVKLHWYDMSFQILNYLL